ncbi:MAG TPA: FCD domain-containing protein [Pseudonocardiaceae bacterium]|nr:FCD domain-containing protein [Pseudonocardiaceae bacterium]
MSLTDDAIAKIRELVRSGRFVPGGRLPSEHELAAELGVSRSPVREAVKALAVCGVLDVRRGDGTYVTSLAPGLLLAGLDSAVDLMHGDAVLELIEVRKVLEPAATALAASRASEADLAAVHGNLVAMCEAAGDVALLDRHDAAFHHAVAAATGNEALTMLLDSICGRTLRARLWRGLVPEEANELIVAQHSAIYDALVEHDAEAAHASALLHVITSERWLRRQLPDPH